MFPLQTGDTIAGRFELQGLVASGGMGRIHRALDRQSGKIVAIKLLARQSAVAQERFLRESVVLAEIQHPGVVRYIAHGTTIRGDAYLVMEWLEGEDLSHFLNRRAKAQVPVRVEATMTLSTGDMEEHNLSAAEENASSDPAIGGRLTISESVILGRRLASAVAELHRRGIVHRDIKPSNIFLPGTHIDQLKVVDLGTVWRAPLLPGEARDNEAFVGTPFYMAPEQAQSDGVVTAATDVWAIGTVLYQCLTGRRPFHGDNAIAVLARIIVEEPIDINALVPDLPPQLSQLVMRSLSKSAEGRPANAGEVAERLHRIGAELRILESAAKLEYSVLFERPASEPTGATVAAPSAHTITTAESRVTCMLLVDTSKSAPAIAASRGAHEQAHEQAHDSADHNPGNDPDNDPDNDNDKRAGQSGANGANDKSAASGASDNDGGVSADLGDSVFAAIAKQNGCRHTRMADGTLLFSVNTRHPPADQAERLARAALSLRQVYPELMLAITTSRTAVLRATTNRGSSESVTGDALNNAGSELRRGLPGTIRLEAGAAALLDARFHLSRAPNAIFLHRERDLPTTRTLLGKPTPMVGREAELVQVLAIYDDVAEGRRRAGAVHIHAPAGMGKSRLRHEFERALRARTDEHGQMPLVLQGNGDLVRAGSPYLLVAPILRRTAGIFEGEPTAHAQRKLWRRMAEVLPAPHRQRITALLGEVAGVPFSRGLPDVFRAGHRDPMLMSQLVQGAFRDWLRAECERRPVLIILEDLQWGDQPSVRLLEGVLGELADQPLMVLALARPEVQAVFPRLWAECTLETLSLSRLARDAAVELVRVALGEGTDDAVVEELIQRADGNAFFLEELIRSTANGDTGTMPTTVLGMVQARLDQMGPEAKRILRAASIFGEVFFQDGVAALSGHGAVFDLREWLDDLVAREVIVRQPSPSKVSTVSKRSGSVAEGQESYRFRHALLRDAAYATLTAEDRQLGHGLAGAWLERMGERDGRIVTEHLLQSREPKRALPHLYRAVSQAYESNDFETVITLSDRGVAAGAEGELLGRLRSRQSAAAYWLGDNAAAQRYGFESAEILPANSELWYVAAGSAMVAAARLGDEDGVWRLLDSAVESQPAPGAEAAQLICLCRITFQVLFNGHYNRADRILQRIDALAADPENLDLLTYAQLYHLRSLRSALRGDVVSTLRHLTAAVAAFERAGDVRNTALERTSLAWWWGELGYYSHAIQRCESNLAFCQSQNAKQAITFTKVNLGFLLSHRQDRLADAERVLVDAVSECKSVGNARLEGWAHTNLAGLAHMLGDFRREAEEAERAIELLHSSPSLRAWALAILARGLLALERKSEALSAARESVALADSAGGGLIHGRSLPRLQLARALMASGAYDEAREIVGVAKAELDDRARYLDRSEWRQRFLAKAEHRELIELAEALGMDGEGVSPVAALRPGPEPGPSRGHGAPSSAIVTRQARAVTS